MVHTLKLNKAHQHGFEIQIVCVEKRTKEWKSKVKNNWNLKDSKANSVPTWQTTLPQNLSKEGEAVEGHHIHTNIETLMK